MKWGREYKETSSGAKLPEVCSGKPNSKQKTGTLFTAINKSF
jgi:hypothetical protein